MTQLTPTLGSRLAISTTEVTPQVFDIAFLNSHEESNLRYLLTSKAPSCTREYGNNYFLVTCQDNAIEAGEFEVKIPQDARLVSSLNFLRAEGILVHYGRWLIPGYPQGLWFDFKGSKHNSKVWEDEFFRLTKIRPNPHENCSHIPEVLGYGYMIYRFLFEYSNRARPDDSSILTNFYQWQTAIALVFSRKMNLKIATTFMLLHTVLGKKLSLRDSNFYALLPTYVPKKEAENCNVSSIHRIEKLAAKLTHILTSVSDLVSFESTALLARRADLFLPVGVRPSHIPGHQFEILHQQNKRKICQFLSGHFYGKKEATKNVDDIMLFVTSGPPEYKCKGFDLFIDAIARLNQILKQQKSNLAVFALILVPLPHSGINVPSLHGQAISKGLKQVIKEIEEAVGKRIFEAALRGEIIAKDKLFTQTEMVKLKGQILAARRKEQPPIVTHNINNSESDPILQQLRYLNLLNHDSDVVKVIVIPETEEVIDLNLVETIRGCNMAFFPSFYEPWGYLQALATNVGIPVVTTNLSGYGAFIEGHFSEQIAGYGIKVIDRRSQSDEMVIEELVKTMVDVCGRNPRDRVIERSRAEKLSHLFAWSRLFRHYQVASSHALSQAFPDEFDDGDDWGTF